MSNLTGQSLLNRYFLRKHVGAGGMADVYLSWDNVRSAKLAVKVLRRDLIHNPRFYQMFKQEAELLRKLEHPNIVRLYEFERQNDVAFLVMEWVDGTNLRRSISDRKSKYPLEEASRILQPVCSALHYAHQNHVFHCDVKPANILLHNDGRVLLTDFGVARLAAEQTGGGTPAYMAPEQFSNAGVDGRTDVYSLGVTLYEMLTGGKLPFRGKGSSTPGTTSRERIGWEHLNRLVPSPRQHNHNLSSEVEAVVIVALNKRPEERYPTPMALREAFEHARTSEDRGVKSRITTGPTVVAESPGPQLQHSHRRPTTQDVKGPCLVGRRGELTGQAIGIPRNGLTIGRSRSNQLKLDERSVSRKHASILVTRQGIYIRDEDSSLGTFVNGRKIRGPTLLKQGDVVRIGYHQEFEYRVGK